MNEIEYLCESLLDILDKKIVDKINSSKSIKDIQTSSDLRFFIDLQNDLITFENYFKGGI